jgi:hypothetical protein
MFKLYVVALNSIQEVEILTKSHNTFGCVPDFHPKGNDVFQSVHKLASFKLHHLPKKMHACEQSLVASLRCDIYIFSKMIHFEKNPAAS